MYLYLVIIAVLVVLIAYILYNKYYDEKLDFYIGEIDKMMIYFNNKYELIRNKENLMKQKLNNVDIFIINLRRSVDRKQRILKEVNKYKINNVNFIDAIDGKNIPGDMKYINNDDSLSSGELGCTLSHLKAIKNYHDNYSHKDYVMICEDDITFQFLPFVDTNINEIINNAPKDWEFIELYSTCECNPCKTYVNYSQNKCYSAVCYLINLKGAKSILNKAYIDNKYIVGTVPGFFNFFKSGEADKYITKLCKSYAYTKVFVTTHNDTTKLNSTIHENHTYMHVEREYMDIKKLYDMYQ